MAVHRIVTEELVACGGDTVADLDQVWSLGGQMWFTEVKPFAEGAAKLSVAFQDESTLNLTVGNIWFEVFGNVEKRLSYLRTIVAAVIAGRVEEAGPEMRAFRRIHTSEGVVRVGAMHLPRPWRRFRQYLPYSR